MIDNLDLKPVHKNRILNNATNPDVIKDIWKTVRKTQNFLE